MRSRSQLVRRVVAVVGGLGLAAGAVGIAGVVQANAGTTHPTTVAVAAKPVAKKSVTIHTTEYVVPLGGKVRYYGKTTGIAKNTLVRVQRYEGRKWVNFPATTRVTSQGAYSVSVKSSRLGEQQFRVVVAGVATQGKWLYVKK